MGVMPAHL